jgi:hypothetical protein
MMTDNDHQETLTSAYTTTGCGCDGSKLPDMNDVPMRQLFGEMFKGKQRWSSLFVMVFILAFTFVMVVALVMFFRAEAGDTKGLIMWATLFLTAALSAGMLKMWFWMGMNRNLLAREVKRLEMRIAELQASQSGPRPGGGVFT